MSKPTGSDLQGGQRRSASGHELGPLPTAEYNALVERLTPEEKRVLLHEGTERPFCGGLLHEKGAGTYHCRLCDLPLFRSSAKFESGTGWPSFFQTIDPDHITTLHDTSYGMVRLEIRCTRCHGHLGHLFEDGPPPTGLRYCLNSVSLHFVKDEVS